MFRMPYLSNNFVEGTEGNDHLKAEWGITSLMGYGGNDLLVSGDMPDKLFGGEGNDTLIGGGGDDLFNGNAGDDIISGGEGADVFSFAKNRLANTVERDVITDFDTESGDVLWLYGWSSNRLNYTLEQDGNNAVITLTNELYNDTTSINEITLLGVQISDLSQDDYFTGV